MKYLFCLAVWLPLLAAVSSCDKEDDDRTDPPGPPCTSVAEAPAAFLRYWYFPTGSWWIYQLKDSTPAVYDTVRYGSDREFRQPGDPGGAQPCVWMYYAQLIHSNRTYFPGSPLVAGGPPQRGSEWLRSFTGSSLTRWGISHNGDAGFNPAEACFIHPFAIGQLVPGNRYLIADTLSVAVPAGTFAHTVHTMRDPASIPTGSVPYSRVWETWRTRDVGLIKIEFSSSPTPLSGTTWELVSYYITP